MNKIDYMCFKILQKIEIEHNNIKNYNIYFFFEQEELIIEKKIENIKNNFNDFLDKYYLSLEEVEEYFIKKYKKNLTEENLFNIFTDKYFLAKKKYCFLNVKKILSLHKKIKSINKEKYKEILKKNNNGEDYKINIPIKYFNLEELNYLEKYNLMSIAGSEAIIAERLINLLLDNKFDEFNFILSLEKHKFRFNKGISLENNYGKDYEYLIFFLILGIYYYKDKILNIEDFIYKWKESSIVESPEIFDFIKEINYSKLENFLKLSEMNIVFLPPSGFCLKNYNKIYSLIYKINNIDEIISLNKVISKSTIDIKNNIKKRM